MKNTHHIHSRYDIEGLIGIGGAARVLSAVDKLSNQPVSIKVIPKATLPKDRLVYDSCCSNTAKFVVPLEVYILRRLNHPDVIKFLDCLADETNYYLITEKFGTVWNDKNLKSKNDGSATTTTSHRSSPDSNVSTNNDAASANSSSTNTNVASVDDNTLETLSYPSSDLLEYIHTFGGLTEELASQIFKKIVDVCLYLKSINVYHCDIKAENILLNDNYEVRVIDFGSAWIIPSYSPGHTSAPRLFDKFYGTSSYAAPEVLLGKFYRVDRAEIWSLGILLYTMVCNSAPFGSVEQIIMGKRTESKKMSEECHSLLDGLFVKDPRKRMSLEEIARHPFLNSQKINVPFAI